MGAKINFKTFCANKKALQWFLIFIETHFDLCFVSNIHPSDRSNDYWAKVTLIINDEWKNKPATERQLLALENMGVEFSPDIDRGEAARIIQDQLNRRAVS